MVTFWEETQVAVRSPVSTRTCTDVCSIGFCGTAHDAYEASYGGGNCTRQWRHQPVRCQYGAGMAAFWKYRHIGASAYAGRRYRGCRTYRVCGVFVSASEQILYGVETTAAFQLLKLTHVSRDNPGQSVQRLFGCRRSGSAGKIHMMTPPGFHSALIGLPDYFLLLCAGCRLLRLFRSKSLREL